MSRSKFSAAVLVVSAAGLLLLQQFEGTRNTAYLDSVQVPTICTGSTKGVRLGQRATDQECKLRLQEDTGAAGTALAKCVTAELTQGQYDALLSLTFNVGGSAVCKSTLVRRLNAQECSQAAQEFHRWVYAGGKRLRGLEKRRAVEAALFRKDC